jgi:hypothetical protein
MLFCSMALYVPAGLFSLLSSSYITAYLLLFISLEFKNETNLALNIAYVRYLKMISNDT